MKLMRVEAGRSPRHAWVGAYIRCTSHGGCLDGCTTQQPSTRPDGGADEVVRYGGLAFGLTAGLSITRSGERNTARIESWPGHKGGTNPPPVFTTRASRDAHQAPCFPHLWINRRISASLSPCRISSIPCALVSELSAPLSMRPCRSSSPVRLVTT